MELSGDEKRIQALFSELSLEDQPVMPRFEKLWLRAETNARVPSMGILRPVAMIAAVVVLAFVSLLSIASWYTSSDSQYAINIPSQTIPTMSVPRIEKLLSAEPKISHTAPRRRPVPQRQIERVATQESATLSNWQSPTNIFLQSPTASTLRSLPQLDQSARDLEQFLPKNDER